MMMKIALIFVIIAQISASFENSPIGRGKGKTTTAVYNYRLPNNSIPLRYDLWIKTDIDKGDFDFSAKIKIRIKILENTRKITLHCRNLDIDKIELLKVTNSSKKTQLSFNNDSNYDLLEVLLPKMAHANKELILYIQYHGILRNDNLGFYRGNYTNENNKKVFYAMNQFESIHARKAMPCYDEPGFQAVFGIQIQHCKNFNAISNMPVVSRQHDVTDANYVTTTFKDTPKMQTYLLMFVVSDFKYISNNDTKLEQRIYAKPHSIDSGEAEFALSLVGPILRKLESYFGIEVQLEKIDHVAVSQHYFSAMEGFGAVFYDENYLLQSTNASVKTKYSNKETILGLITHELLHNFFGNLVTMKWWSYVWLEEGFARFYENYILYHDFYGDYYKEKLTLLIDVIDDDEKANPITVYVENHENIFKRFDSFYYNKPAAIIQMFNEALTPKTFLKGVKYFLTAMNSSTVTPDDLHRELQKAFDEDFPGNGIDLSEVMGMWEGGGFPVIHVEKSEEKFILTQENVEKTYTIPITFATQSDLTHGREVSKRWMRTKKIEIENKDNDEWIVLNVNLTGFFKVRYSDEIRSKLIETLLKNHLLIPKFNRFKMLDEFPSELSPMSDFFKLFEYVQQETESMVWQGVHHLNWIFLERVLATKVDTKYQEFIQLLMNPFSDKIGFTVIPGEPAVVDDFRYPLRCLSCLSNHPECLKHELELIESNKKDIAFLCLSVKTVDEATYLKLLEKADFETDENWQYTKELMCSLDKSLLKIFLNKSFQKSKADIFINSITALMKASVEGLETAMDYFSDNFERIVEK